MRIPFCLLSLLIAAPAFAQAPLTRAERSDWLETSRYADVVAFIDTVAASPRLHATSFGYSMEGRALPLVVAGGPGSASRATIGVVIIFGVAFLVFGARLWQLQLLRGAHYRAAAIAI